MIGKKIIKICKKFNVKFLVNDDVTLGLWDDIAMYCVETPDLYN